ncbi:MAG: hypothetical protein KF803_13355 [Cyclobacteriaceae bacterium]|nr:hypothetical protein [Cyclobacteriaceae bacterium]
MKTRALICLFLLLSVVVWAQPGDPGGNPDVPLTGVEWLLLAGGALGIKRFLSGRKKGN